MAPLLHNPFGTFLKIQPFCWRHGSLKNANANLNSSTENGDGQLKQHLIQDNRHLQGQHDVCEHERDRAPWKSCNLHPMCHTCGLQCVHLWVWRLCEHLHQSYFHFLIFVVSTEMWFLLRRGRLRKWARTGQLRAVGMACRIQRATSHFWQVREISSLVLL